MSNHIFQFKQFSIQQDACAMKVGTDGILLGAWATAKDANRILDIGTGTGLLALMAAQTHSGAQIDAVELDPAAAEQAAENVKKSPWSERIQVFQTDIKGFSPSYLYDLILCNPPFFQTGPLPDDPARIQARHTTHLSYEELIEVASQNMRETGTLALIIPHAYEQDIYRLTAAHHLFPSGNLQVRSRKGKAFHRSLLAFKRGPQQTYIETLSIHDDVYPNLYSQAYQRLTGAFYL